MDELEISGKRYISSKRIAKENKYHVDYIGQLIRAGKIAGTKVGRAWYVEEQSFADYLTKESGTYVSPSRPYVEPAALAPKPVPAESPVPAVAAIQEVIQEQPIRIRHSIEETPTYRAPQPIRRIEEAQPVVQRKVTLTYVPDSNPLLPQIPKRTNDVVVQRIIPEEEYKPIEVIPARIPTKSQPLRTGIAIASLTMVAAIVIFVAFYGSLGISSTINVEKGKPASVGYVQEKTFCFISGNCQN